MWTNPLSGYVYIIYIYQWMSVQFVLHIFNYKFWLQFICNKLISTTAHESVKIVSTKWYMHISHLISVNIFLENFDTFLFVWSFSVMRFLRPLLKQLSVRPPVRSSVRPPVRSSVRPSVTKEECAKTKLIALWRVKILWSIRHELNNSHHSCSKKVLL